MPSSQANPVRKSTRKHLKDVVGTVENWDIKQQILPTRKATKIRAQNSKKHKKNHSTKGDHKRKGHRDMSKIKCVNCDEYRHFT